MLDAFVPNKSLTGRAWATLLVVQGAMLLALWSFGGALSIPTPLDVLRALHRLVVDEGLLYELKVSLIVNVQAILISSVLSIGFAYLTVIPAARPFVAFCSKARFFSLAGFLSVFTFAFGGGHGLKVALLTFGMSVFFITSMASVVEEIPKEEWDQARTLRMSNWRSVWEIVVLGRSDAAFEILRQNAAIGWMMLTMVEGLVRSEGGIGAMMVNSAKYRQFDIVFAVQLTLFIVGITQDLFIGYLKNIFCPYANLTLERR
jgi:NitT/TauT family transport system permease protein